MVAVRITPRAVLVMLVLSTGACQDLPTPATADPEVWAENRGARAQRSFRSVDEEFSYLADWVPGGFGGLYYDSQGRPTVFLRDLKRRHGAAGVLNAHFRQRTPDGRGALRGLRFVQGQHDFAELAAWRSRINQEWAGLAGVVSTDVDEALNRVTVGVETESAGNRVRAALRRLGIPPEAVLVRVERSEAPALRLDERAPAVAGGYFIQWLYGGCTLGFNAYSGGQRVFVTAAHCSNTRYATDANHYYYQWRTAAADDRIGYEYYDPAPYYDSVCHQTYACRWADALLGLWTVNRWDYGRIARTQGGPNAGSLVVDPFQPTFSIIGETQYGMVGDEVHKMGAITGWTRATITRTCVSSIVGNAYTPCLEEAPLGGQQGDSGAPVFSLTEYPGWVRLRGVLSKPSAFSNMFDIETDLGPLQTELCTTANPYYPYC